ncbi:MAG: hypothetical protein NWE81_02140 [Candidatus Bathyarchaeota archaeon]|nr:hypothetical protein [Candidatus Bathyarchaeota archaeon]
MDRAAEGYRIPAVTSNQMREVDRLMIEKYDVQLVQMMENAALKSGSVNRVHAALP